MTPAPRLLMVGMSTLDQLWGVESFPPTRSRTPTYTYRSHGGGPAATAAVTAARLGAAVSLWSLHGDDRNGWSATEELERYGVDCSGVHHLKGAATPVSAVLVTREGERFIFPYRDPRLAAHAGTVAVGELGAYTCVLLDTRYPDLSRRVLRAARPLGLPCVGDFDSTRHWHLAEGVTHLIVSEECAREVAGRGSLERALDALRQHPTQTVGITLGEKGFLYDAGAGVRRLSAFQVPVRDTTGAGDVFHGAYAYAVARSWKPELSARFASAAAALSCRGTGREAIPTREQVEALLAASA